MPAALHGRTALAVALTVGFLGLSIAVAAFLVGFPVYMLVVEGRVQVYLDVAMVGAGVAIVRELIARRTAPAGLGLRVTRDDQPALWQEVSAVASAADQDPPAEIVLTLDVNASVHEAGAGLLRPGRRVLTLGLPLMAALTREEMRAILAHEFGHYAGGDTRLSGWLWRVHETIGATIASLMRSESAFQRVIGRPFLWYGHAFVRITMAMRRRQEFAADALAAGVAGRAAAACGLRRVTAAAGAWDRFWWDHGVPALRRGLRPALLDGYRDALASERVAADGHAAVEARLAGEEPDPCSTHPTLRERLDHLAGLTGVPERMAERDESALELIADAGGAEVGALAAGYPDAPVPSERLAWGDYVERVAMPATREVVAGAPAALDRIAAGRLPASGAELDAVAARIPDLPEEAPSQWRRRQALRLVGHGLVAALAGAGWTLEWPPAETLRCRRGEDVLEPWDVVSRLADGRLPAAEWWDTAVRLGVQGLALGATPAFVAGVEAPRASFGPPVAPAQQSRWSRTSRSSS